MGVTVLLFIAHGITHSTFRWGQAFDVCHKQNPRPKKKKSVKKELGGEKKEDETVEDVTEPHPQPDDSAPKNDDSVNTANDAVNTTGEDVFAPLNSTLANGTPPLINFDPFAPIAPPPPVELQIASKFNLIS